MSLAEIGFGGKDVATSIPGESLGFVWNTKPPNGAPNNLWVFPSDDSAVANL